MRRALISVYNKEGIIEFASELVELGWSIISTGGTSKHLNDAGIETIEIMDVTQFPEILDGRVKTLNPRIHGGLLFKRKDKDHIDTVNKHHIQPIDLVVNNLYPFEETMTREGATHEEIIEDIDIGGPSMIRSAAKNFEDVTVVLDPNDYDEVIRELRENGDTTLETRRRLAGKVFRYTAYYDALIGQYFVDLDNLDFPEYITLPFKDVTNLRYGENPHQKAAFYKSPFEVRGTISNYNQLHGKELSFNNINDSNGALNILKEYNEEPTVVAVKHANPCGIGSGETLLEAYQRAYESDTSSIFGGILALNREVDRDVAEEINKIFIEIVMAPSFSKEALEILSSKKNIRLLEIKDIDKKEYSEYDCKKVVGGILFQDRDEVLVSEDLEVVTERQPTDTELDELMFAWKAVKQVKSNGVVIVKDKGTIGIGMGEVNRFWAVENAIKRAGDKIEGSVLASDGFFPFKDSIEALGKAGVKAIIQPGGSIKDKECIEEANKHNIAMVFTHIRHFSH